MSGLSSIVLAAGKSSRFGADKLVRPFRGAPLFMHAVRAACAAPVERVVIVKRAGAEMDAHCRAEAAKDARIELIDVAPEALSNSLRAGLTAVSGGALVFLGDMPLIPPGLADLLAERLGDHFAVQPIYKGSPGHPVLLSARAAKLAATLSGDQGAGPLLYAHAQDVVRIETEDDGVVFDVDTPADFERLADRAGGEPGGAR